LKTKTASGGFLLPQVGIPLLLYTDWDEANLMHKQTPAYITRFCG